MAPISRILVPVDLGESTARTLEYARSLARPLGATLTIMHVVPNPYEAAASEVYLPPPQAFLDRLGLEAEHALNAILTDRDRVEFKAETVVAIGDPLLEIVEYARAHAVDLIVMGTHGRTGVAHLVLGSVAERVVRTAPCAVLTLR